MKLKNKKTDRTVGLNFWKYKSSIQPYGQFFCFSVSWIPNFADQIHQDPVPLLCPLPFLKFKVFISIYQVFLFFVVKLVPSLSKTFLSLLLFSFWIYLLHDSIDFKFLPFYLIFI